MATQKPIEDVEPRQPAAAVDRKVLRDEIARRFEHTLRRLAR